MLDAELKSREKWWVLGMLWVVCLLNYADRQAISSLFPLLKQEFGFNNAELGLIGSAFMWVYALSSPLAGVAGDRKSRKRLIVAGCLLWSLMTGLTGFCMKIWQFVAARSFIGLGESVYFPSATSILSAYHERTRSTALSFHQSAVYMGTIAGGWIAALIAEHFGWRTAFYGFGVAGLFAAVMVGSFLREPSRESLEKSLKDQGVVVPGIIMTLRNLLRRPGVLQLMFAFAFANGVAAVFLVWAPTFLYEKFHLGLVAAGFSAVAAIQISSALSAPLSGILADYLSRKVKGARMLIQGGGLILGALAVAEVGRASTMHALVCAMICFGLCKGAYDGGIFASAFDLVPANERASVAGLMNLLGWGGGALGPLAIGIVSTFGQGSTMERMSRGISWSALAYLVASGLILMACRTLKDQRTPH